jgi:hypothetical protein
MPFTDAEVTAIIDHLRTGKIVKHATCASRYVMTWSYVGGQWHFEDWQEGESFGGVLSEQQMRANIAAAPDEAFAHLVRQPPHP